MDSHLQLVYGAVDSLFLSQSASPLTGSLTLEGWSATLVLQSSVQQGIAKRNLAA